MKNRLYLAFAFVLLVIMTIPIYASEDFGSGLSAHFIDVGQGDSAFIQLPSGPSNSLLSHT